MLPCALYLVSGLEESKEQSYSFMFILELKNYGREWYRQITQPYEQHMGVRKHPKWLEKRHDYQSTKERWPELLFQLNGITFLPVAGKVFSNLIYNRLRAAVDSIMREELVGFRQGRGCSDQIFVLHTIIEECEEWKTPLIFNIVDFKKAFDFCSSIVDVEDFRSQRYCHYSMKHQRAVSMLAWNIRNGSA